MIRLIVFEESLSFLEHAWDLCFQNRLKSSWCQREIRLWLHKEKRLFPGPNHSGQKHYENRCPK